MAHLNWTEQALADLICIREYISKDSARIASIHIRRIKEKARLLKELPELGRIVPETNNESIRELIFGNYRIIYRLKDRDKIDILTVFHSSRNLNLI